MADTSGRRREIERIAAELFARRGYHATGIIELGEAVGLGKGALYHHIGSKEELLFSISSRHVMEMVDYAERVLAADVSPIEKFRRVSRHLMRTIADNRPELTVYFTEQRSLSGSRARALDELRERLEALWLAILEEGAELGVFRSIDPVIAVKALIGLHNSAYAWFDPDGPVLPEDVSDLFCDLLLRGLLTPDAVASRLAI